jgi:hypothetical protein
VTSLFFLICIIPVNLSLKYQLRLISGFHNDKHLRWLSSGTSSLSVWWILTDVSEVPAVCVIREFFLLEAVKTSETSFSMNQCSV